jgi:hypothetical protein
MSHFLAKASLAALLALCSIPLTTSAASAAGPDTSLVVQAQYHRPAGACSPIEAVRKARYSGLRDPRIISITQRSVVVSGRDRHGRDRMAFANVRGCPLLRR